MCCNCCAELMGICLGRFIRCMQNSVDKYNAFKERLQTNDVAEFEMDMRHTEDAQRYRPCETFDIHTAVRSGNSSKLRKGISKADDKHALFTATDSTHDTPLHIACALGKVEIIEELLEHGCPADLSNQKGTPIHCLVQASSRGLIASNACFDAIQKLVDLGCNIDGTDIHLKTALLHAAEQADSVSLRSLLDLGADVNSTDTNGFSALYMACIKGDLKIVKLLLRHPQIQVDLKDTTGRTALVSSLITITNNFRYESFTTLSKESEEKMIHNFCRISIVEELLSSGADPNALDHLGRSALVIAFTILELDSVHMSMVSDYLSWRPGVINRAMAATTGTQRACSLAADDDNGNNSSATQSIYAPLIRMLVIFGARLPVGYEKDYKKGPDWLRSLYDECAEAWQIDLKFPRILKLTHLCRLALRRHLASLEKLHLTERLPLPPHLSNYVCVNYV